LDHLRHLSQWSRRILLVTGAYGIGKSTLYHELSNTLEAKAKAARLSGTVVTSPRDMMVSLTRGFGIATAPEATTDEMAALVTQHVQEQEEHDRFCICMVDDGHLLDAAAVSRLVELVLHSPLRVVMFAESTVVPTITRACKKHSLEWFEIRLTGLPKNDVRDYLEWRFRQAQYRGRLPFTDEQVADIATRSGGNPGVIDGMSSELLTRLETGDLKRKGGFPTVHAVLALLIACVVFLIYEIARQGDAVDVSVPTLATQPASEAISTDSAPATETADAEEQPIREQPEEDPLIAQTDGHTAVAEPTASDANEASEESDVTGTLGPGEPALADDAATPEVAAEVIEPEPVESAQPEPRAAAEPPAVAETQQPASAAESMASQIGIRDTVWILRQDPQSYTLQLVTTSTRERAEAFVNRQADADAFAVYALARDGRRLHVVVYGVFSSAAAARSASESLTGELQSLEPWVRPMHLVQDAARTAMED
jgi:DamX protein